MPDKRKSVSGQRMFRHGAQEFFSAYGHAVDRARDILAGEALPPSVHDERFLLRASGLYGMLTGAWTCRYADRLAQEAFALRSSGAER